MKRALLIFPVVALCAACASTQTQAPAPANEPDPQVASLAPSNGPPECANPINAFQKIIATDVGTGSLDRNVFPRIATDLSPVRALCASGDGAQALRELQATKRKYGYR